MLMYRLIEGASGHQVVATDGAKKGAEVQSAKPTMKTFRPRGYSCDLVVFNTRFTPKFIKLPSISGLMMFCTVVTAGLSLANLQTGNVWQTTRCIQFTIWHQH